MTNSDRALYIGSEMADQLPLIVRGDLSKRSAEHQQEFAAEFRKRAKAPNTAVILALFGLQNAYMGRWGVQVVYWLVALVTMGVGAVVWSTIDLFRMGAVVRQYNEDVALNILTALRHIWDN